MKVYRINQWAFGGICLLIVLLPVSRHWKLLTSGEKTRGTVTAFTYRMPEEVVGERSPVEASEIEFEANGVTHRAYGPDNYMYRKGRVMTVFYDPADPAKNCVASFTGFYLNYYAAIPIILLVLWYAFYLSFNNYRKKIKMPDFGPEHTGEDSSRPESLQAKGKLPLR